MVVGVVVVAGQADLPEVVGALRSGGGLAGLLDGGEEEPDEDGDDRDRHQQLDQRKCPSGTTATTTPGLTGAGAAVLLGDPRVPTSLVASHLGPRGSGTSLVQPSAPAGRT